MSDGEWHSWPESPPSWDFAVDAKVVGEVYHRCYNGKPTGRYEAWYGYEPSRTIYGSLKSAQEWVEEKYRRRPGRIIEVGSGGSDEHERPFQLTRTQHVEASEEGSDEASEGSRGEAGT